ncbi:MAG: filamentous hemagglutinin N-terminal domain-containing protein [Brasilonema angustatum HA4187-MV1]|jgi:filamentous hemagglutinin family protein|nr:filamentous hemagglutinin N-terminal domain-containing protein [Brasilonema angustatum HA4187-MV1]
MLSRKPVRHPFLFFTLPLATVFSLTYFSVARAQITPDNSLGAESSVVAPNVEIKGIPSDRIDGGATRGTNLFHSFQEFNINAGRGAYFSNPAGIANILTRVTGGNVSNIQGVLGVLGNANLFLINPNGIIFGPNARLDVGGSFLGSTANSLIFKNNFEFSATNPQAPPLLTINVPIGLRFRDNPGNITNQSRALDTSTNIFGLAVKQGNSLTLVGGDVSLDGGILFAPGGRVELGGLSAPGTVGLNADGSLSFPVGVQRGDVSLTNGAEVGVNSGGGGSIAVNARNLNISGGSGLYAGIGQGLGTVGSQAGDITLDATGDIKVAGSYVFNYVASQAVGNSGNINITTGSLSLTDGARLIGSTLGQGNAGNVSVRASGAVDLAGSNTTIFSTVEAGGVGNGGNIDIKAAAFSLKDGAQLLTLVRQASDTQPAGRGDAGNVIVDVTGPVTIAGVGIKSGNPGAIFSYVGTRATGNGGNITISSGSFSLSDGAQLIASTFGQGNAGSVSVRALGFVELADSNTGFISAVEATGVGKGGNIDIKAATLSLKDGARLDTSTRGVGDAGNVTIFSSRNVLFEGVGSNGSPSGVFSTVQPTAKGNGGSITLQTGTLSVTNGAAIIASTLGQGNAGNVNITASDTISFNGIGSDGSPSGISSSVGSGVVGGGGGIKIEQQERSNNPQERFTEPQILRFSITIEPFGNASFPDATGNSGNISITTRSLSVTNGARLTTSTFGGGKCR